MFIQKVCLACHIPFTTTTMAAKDAKCPWCKFSGDAKVETKLVVIKTMEEFHSYIPQLPVEVVCDISQRISDWICSGGNQTDSYVLRQFEYAAKFVNRSNEERGKQLS